jgi:3-hydroxyisobutyrate dehydrogenase-like beta-hydroxyacid dehydrogenase
LYTSDESVVFAVLGLGEAGGEIARDLAAGGARVVGWDPAGPASPDGVEAAAGEREAVAEADLVLSANSASVAVEVAGSVAPALREGALYADLNTGAPGLKRAVAEALGGRGADFVDVALMAPVPGRGVRTPALASGPGAERFAAALRGFGMPVTDVGPEVGAAAARKLVRSVFAKGLAAAVGEALDAADRLGCGDWLYGGLERTLEEADAALLRRLVEGSRKHAGRRVEEMTAAVAMLEELGVEPRVAAASEAWLRSLSESEVAL